MTKNVEGQDKSPKPLVQRLHDWMNSEGFPTEFRTANLFRRHGFHAQQGQYVAGEVEDTKREVDVIASSTFRREIGFTRLTYIVECKWSVDKPWIVFTSAANRMAQSAIAAQTISSKLGAAAMWAIAGNEALSNLCLFSTPQRGGFGGRQAFNKGSDHFYSAVQSVVANASSYVRRYDTAPRKRGAMPEACVMAFPIIVVEGELFEAYFDENSDQLAIKASSHIRCHWKGSSALPFLATVDIVSLSYLEEFLAGRTEEYAILNSFIEPTLIEIESFRTSGSRAAINITTGPRGFRGVPALIAEFSAVDAEKSKHIIRRSSGIRRSQPPASTT